MPRSCRWCKADRIWIMGRIPKERSKRRRRLRRYLKALADLTHRKRPLKRDDLHQALGAAKKEAGRDTLYVRILVTLHGQGKAQTATLTHRPRSRATCTNRFPASSRTSASCFGHLEPGFWDSRPRKNSGGSVTFSTASRIKSSGT